MTPGVYPGLDMAEYLSMHAVSASMVKTLLDECPRAAWWGSWLNPRRQCFNNDATDLGSFVHEVLLEGSMDCVEVIDPNDHPAQKTGAIPTGFTNKSIKAARDAARAEGKIPILKNKAHEVETMVSVAWEFIHSLKDSEPAIWKAFQPGGGTSEVTALWQEGDTLCRLRADRISTDNSLIIDFKTSARSVEPGSFGRSMIIGANYYVSAEWYRRGIKATTGTDPTYIWLCQEVEAPYLCSLVGIDPATLALAAQKVDAGLRIWQECVSNCSWPGYPNRVAYIEAPPWEQARWMEREAQEEEASVQRFERAGKAPSRFTADEMSGGLPL